MAQMLWLWQHWSQDENDTFSREKVFLWVGQAQKDCATPDIAFCEQEKNSFFIELFPFYLVIFYDLGHKIP